MSDAPASIGTGSTMLKHSTGAGYKKKYNTVRMAKNLLIVESPAKAKTIEGILGKDFEVKSCYGHIRDLEKNDMGIDIKNNFEPKYIVPAEKEKVCGIIGKIRFFYIVDKYGIQWEFEEGHTDIGSD